MYAFWSKMDLKKNVPSTQKVYSTGQVHVQHEFSKIFIPVNVFMEVMNVQDLSITLDLKLVFMMPRKDTIF